MLRRDAMSQDAVQRLVREAIAQELTTGGLAAVPKRTAVDSAGATTPPADAARRLSSSTPTIVSVDSRHPHEFPDGHTCGTIDGFMAYLPLKADGSEQWDPSPSDVTDEYTISTVADGWSTTRLQSLPAPYKIVHDASCALPPTLTLGLNTTVTHSLTIEGSLIVQGLDILAALSGAPVWTSLVTSLNTAMNVVTDEYLDTPAYAIKDGLVYLRGAVKRNGGLTFTAPFSPIMTLPAEARPAASRIVYMAALAGGTTSIATGVRVHILTNGVLSLQAVDAGHSTSYLPTTIFLDNVYFALDRL